MIQPFHSIMANKVFLFYFACLTFLYCGHITHGQPTGELFEEDPAVALRAHNNDQIRAELAMMLNDNFNWDKINRLFGEKLLTLFTTALNDKNKRDDDVPPGFIGVRGRRSRREFEDVLRNLLSNGHSNLLVADSNMVKGPGNKKSDSNAYKDGFLGVRG